MSGGIKGYPSSQKLVKGQPPITEFVTLQPTDIGLRASLDTSRPAFRVDSDTIPRVAGAATGNPSTGFATEIEDTATPARVGDFVRFLDGGAAFLEVAIVAIDVSGNSFTLASKIPAPYTPAPGDEFYIMRYTSMRADDTGAPIVAVTQGPIQYVYDGVDTEVEEDTATPANNRALPTKAFFDLDGVETPVSEDTVTPANSVPFPVKIIDPTGVPYDTDYGLVGAQTLRSAAQIGNETGAADFDLGVTGPQTLRTAANIGNATGAADFDAGPTTAQTLRVVVSNDQTPSTFQFARLDYVSSPVGAVSYVQLIAATTAQSVSFTLFDGGGYAMELAIGPAASEVPFMYIPPGGFNGMISAVIPSGSRLSVKCLETGITVDAGQLVMNLLG